MAQGSAAFPTGSLRWKLIHKVPRTNLQNSWSNNARPILSILELGLGHQQNPLSGLRQLGLVCPQHEVL